MLINHTRKLLFNSNRALNRSRLSPKTRWSVRDFRLGRDRLKMRLLYLAGVMALVLMTGCFALPAEEPPLPPPAIYVPVVRPMRTTMVTEGDAVRFVTPLVTIIPTHRETLHFNVGWQRILDVYVSAGDVVQAGDVIAEVERPYLLTQLENAIWEEEGLLLELSQLAQRQALTVRQGIALGTTADISGYTQERERLNGQLYVVRMRLDFLRQEVEDMVVRAPFDGTIIWAMEFSGVMWSQVGQHIATIAEPGQYIFRLTGSDAAHVEVGEAYDIVITFDSFPAVAIDPETLGVEVDNNTAHFAIVGESPVVTPATLATVRIIHEAAYGVLVVPNPAVNFVGDRIFVQVLEDGVIVLRDVEVGVVGNSVTEVISGLEYGDVIVL